MKEYSTLPSYISKEEKFVISAQTVPKKAQEGHYSSIVQLLAQSQDLGEISPSLFFPPKFSMGHF